MLDTLLAKIFGAKNQRELNKIRLMVAEIYALESEVRLLSDAQLAAKTAEFRNRLEQGATLDDATGSYGRITGAAEGRIIQFALKYVF